MIEGEALLEPSVLTISLVWSAIIMTTKYDDHQIQRSVMDYMVVLATQSPWPVGSW